MAWDHSNFRLLIGFALIIYGTGLILCASKNLFQYNYRCSLFGRSIGSSVTQRLTIHTAHLLGLVHLHMDQTTK